MGDIQLVVGIKNGDRGAFNIFFKMHYKNLLAYMTTFTNNRDQAEDLVQQAFVLLWENRSLLDENRSPKQYLYTIALNQYKVLYRKQRQRTVFLEELKQRALLNVLDKNQDEIKEKLLLLKKSIDALPPRCKEILIMNKFEGLLYAEIAERLQISVKTVEAQMRIAYEKIRKGFNKESFVVLWALLTDDSSGINQVL